MSHGLGKPPRPLSGGRFTSWDPADQAWFRVYHRDYLTPNGLHRRTHGPHARFDHHRRSTGGGAQEDPDGRSIIYFGKIEDVALAEAFWDQHWNASDPTGGPIIARACSRHYIAQIRPRGRIDQRLLTLEGDGADAIGALPELSTSPTTTYPLTQEWATAIYEDVDAVGIHYLGAHQLGESMALFDTAPELEIVEADGQLRDQPMQAPHMWDRLREIYARPNRTLIAITPDECPLCRNLGLR